MADDFLRFEASFGKLDEAVQRFVAQLTEELQVLRAKGDTVRAAQVESQLGALRGPGGATGAASPVLTAQELVTLYRRAGEANARNLQISVENLSVLRLQAEQLATIDALNRGKLAPQLVIPPDPRYGTRAQTAGGMAASEEAARINARLAEENALRTRGAALAARQLDEDRARLGELEAQNAVIDQQMSAYSTALASGFRAGQAGRTVGAGERAALASAPPGLASDWTKGNEALARYNVALGEYSALSTRAGISTAEMTTNLTRLGIAEAQASNELRRHGALTTEYLAALARGETTIGEFGYQLGSTIAKFGGWAAAAAATYAAFGAVHEFGKGAVDAASGVQQLTRTIDNLDKNAATKAITGLSQATNVPIKESADAIFQFSRTFHTLDDATLTAGKALALFKLDGVSVNDTMRAATAIHQQYGLSARGLVPVFDELATAQRLFNARTSDMIPLLQRSAGAVKNAGGDLTQFIQIAATALRTTQLSGSQLGTIFQRSAANFLNPATPKGQTDLATLAGLGINTNVFGAGGGGITKLFEEMIQRSATLSNADRQKLALAFSGTGLGGRAAALFGGGGAALLPEIQRQVNPQASRGALQQELDRQLGTVRERMHAFVNEMQRFGVAIGSSGIIQGLSHLLELMVTVGGAIRPVVEAFDQLPGAMKEVISGLVAVRLAMLFLSRTRFGASIPGSRFARIPGLDPSSADQSARAELSRGTRQGINQIEQSLAQSTAQSTAIAAQRVTLAERAARLEADMNESGTRTEEQMTRYNSIVTRMIDLQRQEARLEEERNAQGQVLADLKAQQVGLTASRFSPKRYSETTVASIATGAGVGEEEGALSADTAAQRRLAASQRRLAGLQKLQVTATGEAAAALREATAAAEEEVAAAERMSVAMEEETAALETERGVLAGAAARVGAFVAAIDPILIALIALPFAIDAIKNLFKELDKQTKQLAPKGITSAQQLSQQAQTALNNVKQGPVGLGPFSEGFDSYQARVQAALQLQAESSALNRARSKTLASPVQQVGLSIATLTAEADADTKAFEQHKITKDEYIRRMSELQRSVSASVDVQFASTSKEANNQIHAFTAYLHGNVADAMNQTSKGAKDFLASLVSLSDDQLAKNVDSYSARSEVFGLRGGDLQKAGQTYLYLAAKMRDSTDPKQLQQVSKAQQTFIGAINKNVDDLLKSAQSAPSYSAEIGDDRSAISLIQQSKARMADWVRLMERKYKNYPEIIAAVEDAAKQADAQINDKLKSAIQQQLQDMQSHAQYLASTIRGSSPEDDIRRSQTLLSGMRDSLQAAQAEHADPKTIEDLMRQVNEAENNLIKQKVDEARGILEAQGQLATASITGIGPAADIARARQDVQNARNILAFDQSHGAGQRQILEDQAALDNSLRSLNQTMQSQAQALHQQLAAFIQAKSTLAQSQTTDPIKQAQEQLAADVQVLGTIQRSDFQTEQEYLTALYQQQAKINQDRQKIQDQIIQTDERNLQFEFNTGKIGDQQYINGLERILKTKKLTLEQKQQLEEQIYNLKNNLGKGLDLNVGNIKLPSIYQIRRAIGLGQQGQLPGAQNTVINHSAEVTVNVYGPTGAAAVGTVLDQHLNTSVRAAMRAKGAI